MSWDEDYPDWFRRFWRRPLWRRSLFPYRDFFEDIDRMFEEMFKDFFEDIPKELIKERKLPDGSSIKQVGPIVYGYSVSIGPDGKPKIREFGNIKPSLKGRSGFELKYEREPLVDIIEDANSVRIIAELPGVDKEDIHLESADKRLTISVDTEERKYYKELELPAEVDPQSAKAKYKNGVLEVILSKKEPKREGRKIRIE